MGTICGKSMLGSLCLSILLITCLSFDFGSANSSAEAIEANNWKIMAKTELTCTGNRILKKGITEMDCLDIAENNNRSFIWYARKTAQFQQPEVCAVYESCDLKKGGRLPTRPGHTGAIIDRAWDIIAETAGTCAEKQVFRRTGPEGVSFEKCIELMNENKDANFVWFSDITMKKKKANCAGYKKCDLEKRVAMPGQPGVTIKKIHTPDADNA